MQLYLLAATYLLHLRLPIPLRPIMHLVQIRQNASLVSFVHCTEKSFATKMCILVGNICRWCKTISPVKYLYLAQNFSNCQIFSLMANYFHCWIVSVCKLLCIVKYSRILFANNWQGVNKDHKQKEELKKEDCIQSEANLKLNDKFISDYFSIFHLKLILLSAVNTTCLIKIKLSDQQFRNRSLSENIPHKDWEWESHCQIFRSDKHTGEHICTGTQHTAIQVHTVRRCTGTHRGTLAQAHTADRGTDQYGDGLPSHPWGQTPEIMRSCQTILFGFVNCVSNNMRWGHYI